MASVLQDWVTELPLMQQTVLLTAVRGPDGIAKDHVVKDLLRWYRRCILISAFDKEVLTTPHDVRGGSFTGPSMPEPGLDDWVSEIDFYITDLFIRSTDELPYHFLSHLRQGAEIIGYKHPDEKIRNYWHSVYCRMCDDLHVNPETEEQMNKRLGDNKEDWLAAGDRSSCGRDCDTLN